MNPLRRELLKRLPLTALAVLICYQFSWTWLRFVTSDVALHFAFWRGYPAERLSPHLIAWNGHQFEFGIACTFADVCCGALPLLWLRNASLLRNGLSFIAFAVGLFVLNLLRNAVTDVAFSAGVAWPLADNAIGALSYFAVWVFLVRRLERDAAITSFTASTASLVTP